MKKIILCTLMLLSLFSIAQKKKKLTLEEQVRIAKEQEAAAKKVQPILMTQKSEKPDADIGATLVPFNVVTWDEKMYFDTSLAKDKPLVLVLFNPNCGHCQTSAKEFYKRIPEFKDANILFVTGDKLMGELPGFMKETELLPLPKTFVISADNSDLTKLLFEYKSIPQVMIYNKNKILQKKFYQDINIDSVLYYLNR